MIGCRKGKKRGQNVPRSGSTGFFPAQPAPTGSRDGIPLCWRAVTRLLSPPQLAANISCKVSLS